MTSRTLWIVRTLFFMAIGATGIALVGASVFYWFFSKDLPQIISLEDYRPPLVTQVYALPEKQNQPGDLVGEFFKERRYLIPVDKIPQILVQAFIAAEDDQFFEHPGINLTSIIRAGIANFRAGHTVQGGSTITQQVVKSLLLTPEKSYTRKIKEVILANRIEKNLTKQQILYLYLNEIYLGHGAYGAQAASRTYFRKDVSELTIAEAAILAGLPQAPGKYSPVIDPKKAKERQIYVLRRMLENKFISKEQMTQAAEERVKIYQDEDINPKYAPFYMEYIRQYLAKKYGDKALYESGMTVSIPTVQANLSSSQKSLRNGLREVDKRIGYRGAIKHVKPGQFDQTVEELRFKLFDKEVGFRILRPDGSLNRADALKTLNINSDYELLKEDEIYQGLVTQVDDHKKIAVVSVGLAKAEIPMTAMRWARFIRGQEKPSAVPLPSLPSQVLRKGDVVEVKIAKRGDPFSGSGYEFSLEQLPEVQGALMSLEVQTGNVLAMVGGYDFSLSEFNRAFQAQRQPGSAFKPIIYSAALERGYTPVSIIVDSPIVYEDEETGKWKPSNFEEKFYGDTTFRQALIKSRNVPTIKLVQAIQVNPLIGFAKRLGLNAQYPQDLSISLGSSTVSLLELTKVYTTFPRLGRKVEPIFITKVIDRDGKTLEENLPKPLPAEIQIAKVTLEAQPTSTPISDLATGGEERLPEKKIILPEYPRPDDPDQVMDPRVAYVMTNLMKEVVDFGTGQKAKSLGRPAAGKTGTTNDYIDAWFMGFTPAVSTGVWVGFDNLKTMSQETGARAALPIWLDYMKESVTRYPEEEFRIPPGVVFVSIDSTNGRVVSPNASQAIKEAFIEGTEPKATPSVEAPGVLHRTEEAKPEDFFKEDL